MPRKSRYSGIRVECAEHPGMTFQNSLGEVVKRDKVYRRFKRRCKTCGWSKEVDVFLRRHGG